MRRTAFSLPSPCLLLAHQALLHDPLQLAVDPRQFLPQSQRRGAPRSSSSRPSRGRARPVLASAVLMARIWRLLSTTAESSRACSPRPRGLAPTSAPRRTKWASTAASILSVLASLPVALAKSLSCLGLTIATGTLARARVAAAGCSSPRWLGVPPAPRSPYADGAPPSGCPARGW
jgi:hypothetical protein